MADGLLDPDAETQGAPREGVQDVHKVGVVGGEAPMGVHPLKVGAGRVQTCRWRHKHLVRTRLNVSKIADSVSEWPLCFLTSYSSNFIGRVASSESCYMGPQAVANQVDVLQRHVGSFLEATKFKNSDSLKIVKGETYRILLFS